MSKSRKVKWSGVWFVTASYGNFEDLKMRLKQPGACCPAATDGVSCQLSLHGYVRRLKCPFNLLMRAICTTHKRSFVIYPPGLTPYARRSHLPLDKRGQIILDNKDRPDWRSTDLEAALDFAEGVKWPESREDAALEEREHLPVHQTQRRWVFGLLLFLGLLKGISPDKQLEKASLVTGSDLSRMVMARMRVKVPTELCCRDGPQKERVNWATRILRGTSPITQPHRILDLGTGPEFWGTAIPL